MSINIGSARLWGATNSSSTHTVVLLNGETYKTDLADAALGSFGWERFILADETSKMAYLIAMCYETLKRHLSPRVSLDILSALFGQALANVENPEGMYVDHQSVFPVPLEYDSTDICRDFVKELWEYLRDPNIVIFGGNDNDDRSEWPGYQYDNDQNIALINGAGYGTTVARRDDSGYWVLFNKVTGAKIRMSFGDHDMSKASSPELVDIKITNFCPFGCEYCYQSSTRQGQHADPLYPYVWLLRDMKVLEVAIGGGEPTLHPGFARFVRDLSESGMAVSFTTRNTAWLREPSTRDIVNRHCASIGFSVDSPSAMFTLREKLTMAELDRRKIVIHYVLGSSCIKDFEEIVSIVKDAGYRLLVLGYKHVGFGQNFDPHDYSDWINAVKRGASREDLRWEGYWIGIDTCVASEFRNSLLANGCQEILLGVREGTHSMYIDAVSGTMGPSSFCDPSEMVDLPRTTHGVQEIFQRWKF